MANAIPTSDAQKMLDALGVKEVQHTYLVDTGAKRPTRVNLRFPEPTCDADRLPDPLSAAARDEAARRAQRMLRRRGIDVSGITADHATFVRGSLVPALAR